MSGYIDISVKERKWKYLMIETIRNIIHIDTLSN